ncbi:MAG: hypothetical protein A2Y40_02095 [Candidatus Margulisbacteria bacterium GWF2_35_9]|nr:MAG: hypothetical protein A2Y40_02095 [Candidatus Margulisbacteria bacterium GWF2_35_9]
MTTDINNIEYMFQQAVSLHQTQKYDQAKKIYQEILKIYPKQSDVIHLLGLIEKQSGNMPRAIQLINDAIKINPRNPVYFYNLGNTYKENNDKQQAIDAYKKVIELEPKYFEAYSNMGLIFQNMGDLDNAVNHYLKALEINPNAIKVLNNLGCVYIKQCRYEEAKAKIEKLLELDPRDDSAKHMFAALNGDTPQKATAKYVADLFDEYASYFEKDLLNKLEYKTPALIREYLPKNKKYKIMDLGCGTGLVGETLADITGIIDGIDLSPKMIEEAKKKKIYNKLWVGDIVEILNDSKNNYNLIIAADVFVYIGNLKHMFRVVHEKLDKDGLFVFSIENLISSNKYELRLSGRYAHSIDYIQSLATDFGFDIENQNLVDLRKEKNKKIEGVLFVLKKQESRGKNEE